ncbi:Protein LTV1 like, partial [Pseudolycoriella hygida]
GNKYSITKDTTATPTNGFLKTLSQKPNSFLKRFLDQYLEECTSRIIGRTMNCISLIQLTTSISSVEREDSFESKQKEIASAILYSPIISAMKSSPNSLSGLSKSKSSSKAATISGSKSGRGPDLGAAFRFESIAWKEGIGMINGDVKAVPKHKKKFIDKKNAITFHLVHRSQHDPLITDETAPQHVLVAEAQKDDKVDCRRKTFVCLKIYVSSHLGLRIVYVFVMDKRKRVKSRRELEIELLSPLVT